MKSVEERHNELREAAERNSIDDMEEVSDPTGLKDFSDYPQFSLVSDFVDYMVGTYYGAYQPEARKLFYKALEETKCEVCGGPPWYIHLTVAIKNCTLSSLWIHRIFCSSLCHDYFYVVKKLDGTP